MEEAGVRLVGTRYTVLRTVKASIEDGKIELGQKDECRFCSGRKPQAEFRNVAHTFPEALGNKWMVSLDECDACNTKFQLYDDALAKAVSPLLTIGGVKGKSNKIRQTGRTSGRTIIKREEHERGSEITLRMNVDDFANHACVDSITNRLTLTMPIPPVPFTPRYAYKALVKMALALMPLEDLIYYRKLHKWLFDVNDAEDFVMLEVAMSLSRFDQALPYIAGILLRRIDHSDPLPYTIFAFYAGNLCFQIDLMSDHLEDHIPPVLKGFNNICPSVEISGNTDQTPIRMEYSNPLHFNWATTVSTPQPFQTILSEIDRVNQKVKFTLVFRRFE